jgi:putative SOS response-associated peptidase YedK
MCGRVRLSSDVSEIKLVLSIPPHRPTPNFAPSWNAAPTDQLPIVRFDKRAREHSLDLARWGLVPFCAKDINVGFANINAKAEGIENRLAFREAFQRRRCLVPVDNFYDWKKTATGKQPYAVALADRRLMALADLWENWRSPAGEWIRSFAVMTTTPKQAERRASQPDASRPPTRNLAPVAWRGARRPATSQSPARALSVGRDDVLAGKRARG